MRKIKTSKTLIKILKILWEQKWLEFDQGMGSTGLDRIEIAKRSNIKESIVSRVLWYLEKTNLVDVGNYEDVLQ